MQNPRDEMPREPMPKSLRRAWVWIGLMAGVVVVVGVVSMVIAFLVR